MGVSGPWVGVVLAVCALCGHGLDLPQGEHDQAETLSAEYLQVGRSLNLLPRYGFLTLSIKVFPHRTDNVWLFREQTAEVFDKNSYWSANDRPRADQIRPRRQFNDEEMSNPVSQDRIERDDRIEVEINHVNNVPRNGVGGLLEKIRGGESYKDNLKVEKEGRKHNVPRDEQVLIEQGERRGGRDGERREEMRNNVLIEDRRRENEERIGEDINELVSIKKGSRIGIINNNRQEEIIRIEDRREQEGNIREERVQEGSRGEGSGSRHMIQRHSQPRERLRFVVDIPSRKQTHHEELSLSAGEQEVDREMINAEVRGVEENTRGLSGEEDMRWERSGDAGRSRSERDASPRTPRRQRPDADPSQRLQEEDKQSTPGRSSEPGKGAEHDRSSRRRPYDSHFLIDFCDDAQDLLTAYFDNFYIEGVPEPKRAFTSSLSTKTKAEHLGIHTTFFSNEYSFVLVRLFRRNRRATLAGDLSLAGHLKNSLSYLRVGSRESVNQFLDHYGTHVITEYEVGDVLYQVYVFGSRTYNELKNNFAMSQSQNALERMERYFTLFYALHVGKVKLASGNPQFEQLIGQHLRSMSFFRLYQSIFKILSNQNLEKHLDELEGEVVLSLKLEKITKIVPKSPERHWLREVLDNTLNLYYVTM